MTHSRSIRHIAASTLIALCAALVTVLATAETSHACGTYGLDENTLIEWAVADDLTAHLAALDAAVQDDRAARHVSAAPVQPNWFIAKTEVYGKRLAMVEVSFTEGQRSYNRYYTMILKGGKWMVIGTSPRIA